MGLQAGLCQDRSSLAGGVLVLVLVLVSRLTVLHFTKQTCLTLSTAWYPVSSHQFADRVVL
jgi:hypothetical protein